MRHQLRFPGMIAFTLLLLAGVAAMPRGAAAQDATSFIQNLGTQGIQALGPSTPAAQRTARFRQLLDADFDVAAGLPWHMTWLVTIVSSPFCRVPVTRNGEPP